jgi:Glycosyl hydrolases family 38 N-terminal domain/Glycosyl hydrolases family 38 C-terminal domain
VSRHLVLVPHTHWDREWYLTHETFRFRLVHLLDGVLDLLERDPGFRHFTLDGQTIVLADYLEVRPGARERIAKLVRDGRLLVGPWFVLPDEWLVSGEALIRNLRRGLAEARALGPVMRIGYVPDQFGHVGQLPQLLAGFGCEGAMLWRGVPAEIDESLFWWEAPDGTRLFTVYLMHGYGNAVHLPLAPDALAQRLRDESERLAARSRIPSLLLMNGSDHVPPQPGLPAALEAALAQLPGTSAEIGTLPGFLARARSEAPESLPVHRGELRSGLRAPLLEGCASARMPLKRADFLNDRLLTRYLEPLATWLAALGGSADPAFLDLAWRITLENHPHDSICGCSIDAVHDQMEARFARASDVAQAHLRRVAAALAREVAAPAAGFGRGAGRAIAVWNPHASGVCEAEGELELDLGVRRPALHLRDTEGRRIPAAAERIDAGEVAASYTLAASGVAILARGVPHEFMGMFVCGLSWGGGAGGRWAQVALGTEKPSGFDLEVARAELLAWLAEAGESAVTFRALRLPRFQLRFVDALPGCGLRVYRIARGPARAEPALRAQRLPGGGAAIENEQVRLEARGDGSLRLIDRQRGDAIEDVLRVVSEGDRGDEYNFDPVPGGERVERPARVRVKLGPVSEAEVSLAIDARYRVPAGLAPGRAARAPRKVWLPVSIRLRLSRGLSRVAVQIDLHNTARDHRLRAHVRAPFAASRFEVESAFEIAERPIAPAPASFGSERPSEFPIGATPQRGFATLAEGSRALSVANRGCAEVEAVPEGGTTCLALTLLRAVGWLSRGDLALRPIHAGPALETPGAQGLGPHRVELAFWLHADGDPQRAADAHRFGAPAWLFAAEGEPDAPLRDGARLLAVDDPAVMVSAIEPRMESTPLIRLYNASDTPRRVRVSWGGPGARKLSPVDLAGNATRLPGFAPDQGASATLTLRPWQIASLTTA